MTKEDILKQTLTLLGLDYNDSNLYLLNIIYDSALTNALIELKPNFAISYKELILTGYIPTNPDYLYEYAHIENCLVPISIINGNNLQSNDQFELCCNDKGLSVICTNTSSAILKYIKNDINEIMFSYNFCQYLSIYLCSLISFAVTGDSSSSKFFVNLCKIMKQNYIQNTRQNS